jgi:hypothetical protein
MWPVKVFTPVNTPHSVVFTGLRYLGIFGEFRRR